MVEKTAAALHHVSGSGLRGRRLLALLLLSTVLGGLPPFGGHEAHAQQSANEAVAFQIPPQPLASAIDAFIRQSGWQISYSSAFVRGKTSPGVSGNLAPGAALQRLVAGSGAAVSIGAPGSAALVDPAGEAGDLAGGGSVMLGKIVVSGAEGRYAHEGATYEAPASVSYYSEAEIQKFRGTSTGDFLKGEPGVMTGDNRNSGAIDINIRGMQGQGRVATVIDGSVQQSTVYRGYSGVASRVYLDPDLVGNVVIEKGPSAAADAVGATGGVARISTLRPDDIILPGRDRGVRLRFSTVGNTASPPAEGTKGTGSGTAERFDRPGPLEFSGGSASLAYAQRFGNLELVAAYARRDVGNYFGGEHGEEPNRTGMNWFGLGEEVLNTSQDNTSALLRGIYRWGNGHSADLSFIRYESDFGEMMPSQIIRFGGAEQAPLSRVEVDTATLRYGWNPENNDWINLKTDLWSTSNYTRIETPYRFDFGGGMTWAYNEPYASQSDRWGININNTSELAGSYGEVELSYGLSYSYERLKPGPDPDLLLSARDGEKSERSAFVAAEYRPKDWLTLNAALRYTSAKSEDFLSPYLKQDTSGTSPILSVMVEPWDGIQLYGRYAEAIRTPSMFESTNGWSFTPSTTPLRPERSANREIGANFSRNSVFRGDDRLQMKLAYFNNDVEDYLTRDTGSYVMTNIPSVAFRGAELSVGYDMGKFYANLAATKYLETEYCATNRYSGRLVCRESGSEGGYGQMHLPPTYSATLTLGMRLMDDKLDLGTRITRIGDRPSTVFSGAYTATIDWQPYTVVDLFGSYALDERVSFDFAVDNVTDEYYMDALNLGLMPSPGRTIRLGMTAKF